MAEYIEREAAIDKTEAFCDTFVTKWTDEKVLAWIRKLPAADVAPVVHGRWIRRANEKKCSVCGFIYYSNNDEWSWCPNCGARMDGE